MALCLLLPNLKSQKNGAVRYENSDFFVVLILSLSAKRSPSTHCSIRRYSTVLDMCNIETQHHTKFKAFLLQLSKSAAGEGAFFLLPVSNRIKESF